ncbi:MAP kinase-activated protein kinase 2 (Fragment) [Seminavis robusta]|uniref:MAP kinase-activated protein kinase 2 n=1 Tax=Seminavis robusta TaxID=568900 RepID=A0A9N8HJB6_9STRA
MGNESTMSTATTPLLHHAPQTPKHPPSPPTTTKPLDSPASEHSSSDDDDDDDDMPPLTETTRSSVMSSPPQHRGMLSNRSEATSTSVGTGGSSGVRAASLAENLMRTQQRNPMDIYKLVSVLGEGSMGSVCKVRKRSSAVGGSARPDFVQRSMSYGDEEHEENLEPCCFTLPLIGQLIHKMIPRKQKASTINNKRPSSAEDYYYDSARSELTSSGGSDYYSCKDVCSSPSQQNHPRRLSSSMITFNNNSKNGTRRQHEYALKSIHLDMCANTQLQKELIHEVSILREIDHPHIARAIETFDFQGRLYICLELCSGGDLYSRDPYTELEAANIVSGVLSAVSYLHSKGIIHRDLKFENIMFADKRQDAEVKLIDFGLSQKFASQEEHMSDAVGTVYTMAPELLAGHYNSKADVWSIGVISYMLMSSSMPFFGKTRYQVMKQICKGKVKFASRKWKKVSKYGKGFVLHLLESDPQERPSADRALKYCQRWIRRLEEEETERILQEGGLPAESYSSQDSRKVCWSSSKHGSFRDGSHDIEMMDRIQASIQAFAQYNTLKRLALMVIAYKSTASEIGWLRSTFNQFDLLHNGEISLGEFTQALSDVYDYSDEEMEALFEAMDVDGTGSVHYTEFLAATIEAHGFIDEDRIADAFDRIDCDDSGFITIQNLRDFLGDDVPQSYLEAIIDDADRLRDKRISYDEFLQLWDPSCDATLRDAKREVAERRTRRSESLLLSLSREGSILSDSDDDDEDDDGHDNPAAEQHQPKQLPAIDREATEEAMLRVVDKTPVISNVRNMRAHEYRAIEFFSQRKALSLRNWY